MRALPPALLVRILEEAFQLPSVVHGPCHATSLNTLRALARPPARDALAGAAAQLLAPVLVLWNGRTLEQYIYELDKRRIVGANVRVIQVPRRDVEVGDRARLLGIFGRCSGTTALLIEAFDPKLLTAADVNLPALREVYLRSGPGSFGSSGAKLTPLDVCRLAARHPALRRMHFVVSPNQTPHKTTADALVPLVYVTELLVTGGHLAQSSFFAPALRVLDVGAPFTTGTPAVGSLAASCPNLEHLTLRVMPEMDFGEILVGLPRSLRTLSIFDRDRGRSETWVQLGEAIEADLAPAGLRLVTIERAIPRWWVWRPGQIIDAVDVSARAGLRAACESKDMELREVVGPGLLSLSDEILRDIIEHANPPPLFAQLRRSRGPKAMVQTAETERARKLYIRQLASTCRRFYLAIDLLWHVVTVRDATNAQAIAHRLVRSPRLGSRVRAIIVTADRRTLERIEEARMDEEVETFRVDRAFERGGSLSNWLHVARREYADAHRSDEDESDDDEDEDEASESEESDGGGTEYTVETHVLDNEARLRVLDERADASASALDAALELIVGHCWRLELLSVSDACRLPMEAVPSLKLLEVGGTWPQGVDEFLEANPTLRQLRILDDSSGFGFGLSTDAYAVRTIERLVLATSFTFSTPDIAPNLTHLEIGVARDGRFAHAPFSTSRDALPKLRHLVLTGRPRDVSVATLLPWLCRTPLESLTVAFGPHDANFQGDIRPCDACRALDALSSIIESGSIAVDRLYVVDAFRTGPDPPTYEIDHDDEYDPCEHEMAYYDLGFQCQMIGLECERIDSCAPGCSESR